MELLLILVVIVIAVIVIVRFMLIGAVTAILLGLMYLLLGTVGSLLFIAFLVISLVLDRGRSAGCYVRPYGDVPKGGGSGGT